MFASAVRWRDPKTAIWRMDIAYDHDKSDADQDELRVQIFHNRNLPEDEAIRQFGAISKKLTDSGIQCHYDIIPPGDLREFVISEGLRNKEQAQQLEKIIRSKLSKKFEPNLRFITSEHDPKLIVEIKDTLSKSQYESLKSTIDKTITEQYLAFPGVKLSEERNTTRTPVIRVTTSRSRMSGQARTAITNGESAEEYLIKTVNDGGFTAGETIREKHAHTLVEKAKELNEWREQNPVRATGLIYMVANSLQMLSGLLRGNLGEFRSGLSYFISNFDLFAGSRKKRSEKEILKDALDDFKDRKTGKIDFSKQKGFTAGDTRFGTLLASYLNWREADGNDISSKAILAIFAGFNAFTGSLKGKKQLVLDENGDVALGANGKPQYHYVKDPALMYDGAMAMMAYMPQVLLPPASTGGAPLVDILPKHKQNAQQENADNKKSNFLKNLYETVEKDPTKATGKMMASRNYMHIGLALIDGVVTLPKKHQAHSYKLNADAIKLLTPHGGEKSLYNQLKQHFSVSSFVDVNGELTTEARNAKNDFIKEYEARLNGNGKKPAIHDEKTKEYLSANAAKYEMALLLGSFDREDKTTKKGIPFINRKTIPSSCEKLIALHEKRLDNPYKPLEKGSAEEIMYVAALNRKSFDDIGASLKLPWVRLVGSVINLAAAMQFSKANEAAKKSPNEAERRVDGFELSRLAAEEIKREIPDNEKAQKAAAENLSRVLADEMKARANEKRFVEEGSERWTATKLEQAIKICLLRDNKNAYPDIQMVKDALSQNKEKVLQTALNRAAMPLAI